MKTARLLVFLAAVLAPALSGSQSAEKPVVIRAHTLYDGRGNITHDVRIVVQNGKILSVEKDQASSAGPVDYDLRRLTVMPGWIDLHDHLVWHFGPNGRLED